MQTLYRRLVKRKVPPLGAQAPSVGMTILEI